MLQQLGLTCLVEGSLCRVVATISGSKHRYSEAMLAQDVLVVTGTVWAVPLLDRALRSDVPRKGGQCDGFIPSVVAAM